MNNFTSANIIESRTAGSHNQAYKSVQSWKNPKNIAPEVTAQHAQKKILNSLEKAAIGKVGTFDIQIQTAQAYAGNTHASSPITSKNNEFQFRDVVDIINPLQHIPLVGTAYRNLTGDELHPMSQIIGGALYGGPVGAITGTANAITKVQTGKDIGDHALELVGLGKKNINSSTEIALNEAANRLENNVPLDNLPQTAQAFVNVAEPQKAIQTYERVAMAEGRTAGSMHVKKNWAKTSSYTAPKTPPVINIEKLAPMEKITSLNLDPMPPKREA
jgi:hypothetical protein